MEIQFNTRAEIFQLTKMLVGKIKPTGFIEIGSRDGYDANLIGKFWDIPAYIVEPHPDLAALTKERYPEIDVYEFAAFNKDGEAKFNAFKINPNSQINSVTVGTSSLLEPIYVKSPKNVVTVPTKRMDTFLTETNISVDIVKIDVEGVGYEVLEGFGDRLKDMKAIQIELEKVEMFKGQTLVDATLELMSKHFILYNVKKENEFQFAHLFINKSIAYLMTS